MKRLTEAARAKPADSPSKSLLAKRVAPADSSPERVSRKRVFPEPPVREDLESEADDDLDTVVAADDAAVPSSADTQPAVSTTIATVHTESGAAVSAPSSSGRSGQAKPKGHSTAKGKGKGRVGTGKGRARASAAPPRGRRSTSTPVRYQRSNSSSSLFTKSGNPANFRMSDMRNLARLSGICMMSEQASRVASAIAQGLVSTIARDAELYADSAHRRTIYTSDVQKACQHRFNQKVYFCRE